MINSASTLTGPIAPGEAITLTGTNLGPPTLVAATIPSTGTLGTSLSNTSVTVNGATAPIIYASATQTAILLPYALAGFMSANIVVPYQNQTTGNFPRLLRMQRPGSLR